MAKYHIRALNKENKIVIGLDISAKTRTAAMGKAVAMSNAWNRKEKRKDVRVRFIVSAGHWRNV